MKKSTCLGLALLMVWAIRFAAADVSVSGLIGDHMVLQRDIETLIWGTADSNEAVTVTFNDQSVSTVADQAGNWTIELASMSASSGPMEMIISGNNEITLTDVQVGEVWLGSGQSNMQRPLSDDCNAAAAIASADQHNLRLFNVTASGGNVANTSWEISDATTAPSFSATHFYFGRHLAENMEGVAIGLISSAVSATAIERWATCAGSGSLYTGQIVPLQPFRIRGATWYQGEWDSRGAKDASKYYWQLPCLISEWRGDWGLGEFPFYVVQMPKMGINSVHIVRDAELQASLVEPNVEMIVTIDQPGRDVHPACKLPFGTRLADLARNFEYGQPVEARSPTPDYSASFALDDAIHVVFDNVAKGLESSNLDPLAEWEIADASGNYLPAEAVIVENGSVSNTVAVSNPSISNPVSARYAFSNDPAANNLVNSAGLPASPIREIAPEPAAQTCGDGVCDPGEDTCSCAADCGDPPPTELSCGDGVDNDCDGGVDCADPSGECDSDPVCASPCNSNGFCEEGENCSNCASDCDGVSKGKPSTRYCCGNLILEGPENDELCDDNI